MFAKIKKKITLMAVKPNRCRVMGEGRRSTFDPARLFFFPPLLSAAENINLSLAVVSLIIREADSEPELEFRSDV